MKILRSSNLLLLSLFMVFCSGSPEEDTNITTDPALQASYKLVSAFPNLSFTRPVALEHAGDNTNRIFVVEQAGVISVFPNNAGVTEKKVFLDIKDKVQDQSNEQGLLGLAFHPNYETNGFIYLNYTAANPERTIIARYKVSASDPDKADPNSELVVLTFNQPYRNHNGGGIGFGPDGFLYIGVGDGGSGGDPQGNGQNLSTMLGSILRINVNNTQGGSNYVIPSDNPFAGNTTGYKKEIYAYGLRNPWRFSFDAETGELWVGDIGQNTYEEIDVVVNGGNYGWNKMEGLHTFGNFSGSQDDLKLPVWEYGRSEGISVTGGYVYRGSMIPDLAGHYIFADYGTRNVWELNPSNRSNPTVKALMKADFAVSSFGVDQNNELYLCGFDGKIYRLERE